MFTNEDFDVVVTISIMLASANGTQMRTLPNRRRTFDKGTFETPLEPQVGDEVYAGDIEFTVNKRSQPKGMLALDATYIIKLPPWAQFSDPEMDQIIERAVSYLEENDYREVI